MLGIGARGVWELPPLAELAPMIDDSLYGKSKPKIIKIKELSELI